MPLGKAAGAALAGSLHGLFRDVTGTHSTDTLHVSDEDAVVAGPFNTPAEAVTVARLRALPRLLEHGPACLLALLRTGNPEDANCWIGAVASDIVWMHLHAGIPAPSPAAGERLARASEDARRAPGQWRARASARQPRPRGSSAGTAARQSSGCGPSLLWWSSPGWTQQLADAGPPGRSARHGMLRRTSAQTVGGSLRTGAPSARTASARTARRGRRGGTPTGPSAAGASSSSTRGAGWFFTWPGPGRRASSCWQPEGRQCQPRR